MKGVAILSDKGGTGKSTICHLLALGAAWRGVPSYLFHTDQREPMKVDGRPYAYIDGRDLERLTTVMTSLINNNGLCVIDGAGNRPDFDTWISEAVDFVLIPVTPDEESVSLGIATMERVSEKGVEARYIVNMTTSNKHSRAFDYKHFFSRLDREKVIGELKTVAAVKRLRLSDLEPFETPPTNVNNLARALYRLVSSELGKVDIELG